jgi:hypothetical protein
MTTDAVVIQEIITKRDPIASMMTGVLEDVREVEAEVAVLKEIVVEEEEISNKKEHTKTIDTEAAETKGMVGILVLEALSCNLIVTENHGLSSGEMAKDNTQRSHIDSTPTSTVMIKGLPSRATEAAVRMEFLHISLS